MHASDWILIATTLFFLGAIAIWGDRIKQWLYPPKIKASFVEASPYCHKTYYRSTPQDVLKAINEPAFFFRFEIENIGASKLLGCDAIMEQLWMHDAAGKPQRIGGNDVTLVWINGRRKLTDLNLCRRDFCNIGHIASPKYQKEAESGKFIDIPGKHEPEQLRFVFELAEYPYSQPNCLLPGTYSIKVMVYSDNASPVELRFEIACSGKWQDNETEMFRKLTINSISKIDQ